MNGDSISPTLTLGGGASGRDLLTWNVTGKIINFSNNNVNMERALSDIKTMVESSYQGVVNGQDVNFNFDFSIAETMEDVSIGDHLIVLGEGKNNKIPGASIRLGGKVAIIDADYFTGPYDVYIGEEGERTSAHELGHLFSLSHSSGGGDRNNLMTQGRAEHRGNEITSSQLGIIAGAYKRGTLNLGLNYNSQGLPNLGIAGQVFRMTNTGGKSLSRSTLTRRYLDRY